MEYLEDQAAKKFNVIQAVLLPEFDKLNTLNANGNVSFINHNPRKLMAMDWGVTE